MKEVIIISCILASALALPFDGKIVGGSEINIESTPYQISIQALAINGSYLHLCGGSILTSRVVVTAAHCTRALAPFKMQVGYGASKYTEATRIPVARYLEHENYVPDTEDRDIALLFLAEDIKFSSRAQPIALTTSAAQDLAGGYVSGWGDTKEGGPGSINLKGLKVDVMTTATCRKKSMYGSELTDNMICGGGKTGEDSCQGDSGGPLVLNGKLVGVVSWGTGCARPYYPGVYTDVSKFVSWINSNI